MKHKPFRGLSAILFKEFIVVWRDPLTLFFFFFPPLIEMVAFGYALDNDVKHMAMLVLNEDRTVESRQLIDRFVNTQSFRVVGEVQSLDQLKSEMRKGTAYAALYIPPLDAGLWADAIEALWDDQERREELGRLGCAQAQRFSWKRAARETLRRIWSWIIVGEVRGSEAFDMLQAMNTGHDGSMSTIHANTPRDALFRLENMVLMAAANLPLRALRAQIASAINLVVHIERMRDGIRRVERICEISGMEGEIVSTRDISAFKYQGEGRDGFLEGTFEPSRLRPDLAAKAAQYGLEKQLLEAVGIGGLIGAG